MVLLVVGTVLLMPPVAGIFLIDGMLGGLPIPLLYVFAVWTGLILCTAVLAPLLRDGDDSSRQAGMGEGET